MFFFNRWRGHVGVRAGDTIDLIFLHSKQLKKLFGFGPHSSRCFSGENDHILSTCTCCEMLKKNFQKG